MAENEAYREKHSKPIYRSVHWVTFLRVSLAFFVVIIGSNVSYGDQLKFLGLQTVNAQSPKQIYYSVGQNTNDHSIGAGGATCSTTGACTVTISGGIATFNYAQTAINMGVGDRVTYDTNKIAYISSKVPNAGNKQWTVVTKLGAIPTNVTGKTVNSIRHEFASLNNAVHGRNETTGADDSNHLNTSDLVAGNYVLNIPLYYDSGHDTTSVTVSWDTGPSNYIKIYTPTNVSNEVNQSQRHSGKWEANKYGLRITLNDIPAFIVSTAFIRIEGLQFHFISNSDSQPDIIALCYYTGGNICDYSTETEESIDGGDVQISSNIIRTTLGGGNHYLSAISVWQTFTNSSIKIWNNVMYDLLNGSNDIYGIFLDSNSRVYAYNNTIVNVYVGFKTGPTFASPGLFISKNNIIQDCVVSCFSGSLSLSDYNISSKNDAPGSHSKQSTIVSFVNKASRDFHLASGDTKAKGAGVNLLSGPYLPILIDIDSQSRPASSGWDIGADQSTYPNLTAGASAPSSATVGTPSSFTGTVSNIGNASTGASFSNFFQVATITDDGGTITDLTATTMGALSASASNTATSPTYTFPSAGTYSVRVCADKNDRNSLGTITESDEDDNCGAWTDVVVSLAAIASISADPTDIPSDTESILSWSYSNATFCSITPPALSITDYPDGEGSVSTGNLNAGRTYIISCDPVGGLDSTDEVAITIQDQFLSLSVIKSGQGTVTGTPIPVQTNIDCGATCSATYTEGTTINLIATPSQGRIFTGWSGVICSGDDEDQRSPTCTFEIINSLTVYANFIADPNPGEF